MKRILAVLCILGLLLACAACGSTQPSTPVADPGTAGDQDAQSELPTDAAADANEDTPAQEITFSEIVVVDNELCTIKITGIDPENLWGYTLNAYLENKSADKTYMFAVDTASVNGVETDPFFAAEVAAGKKSNESISFNTTTLEEVGIGDFTDIELNFRVYDSNDWAAEAVAEVSVHVYPYGEENAVTFVREAQPTDTVLVDNEYATVIVTGYANDDILGYTANLFIVNKTDTTIMVSVDEASVNGFMADPFYADSVEAGKCAFSSISWSDATFEENGITDVETIEFILRVYDYNDWSADDFVNELITLNP